MLGDQQYELQQQKIYNQTFFIIHEHQSSSPEDKIILIVCRKSAFFTQWQCGKKDFVFCWILGCVVFC